MGWFSASHSTGAPGTKIVPVTAMMHMGPGGVLIPPASAGPWLWLCAASAPIWHDFCGASAPTRAPASLPHCQQTSLASFLSL